jgi:hypothetical protein
MKEPSMWRLIVFFIKERLDGGTLKLDFVSNDQVADCLTKGL